MKNKHNTKEVITKTDNESHDLYVKYFQDLLKRYMKVSLTVKSLKELPETVVNELIAELSGQIYQSAKKKNTYDCSLEAKFGKIVIDTLNRDISLLMSMKAIARFFKNDFKTTRKLSRERRARILAQDLTPAKQPNKSHELVKVAISQIKKIRVTDPIKAGDIASNVKDFPMMAWEAKTIGFALYESGKITQSAKFFDTLDVSNYTHAEQRRVRRILSERKILTGSLDESLSDMVDRLKSHLPVINPIAYEKRSTAYLVASSLPQNQAGYTTRAHKISRGLIQVSKQSSEQVKIVTRPAYPKDRFDLEDTEMRSESTVGDITYHHIDSNVSMQDDILLYIYTAAKQMILWCLENNIRSIIAASNHVNALPGLVAARALGINFSYEVRGLWEETKAAKNLGWAETEKFKVDRMMETYTVINSDYSFFITRQVREVFYPNQRPVSRKGKLSTPNSGYNNTDLVPNCADLNEMSSISQAPYTMNKKGKINLVYIGSILEYEGLQTVLEALAKDKTLQQKYKVDIVGGGNFFDELKLRVETLKLEHCVKMHGRVATHEVLPFFENTHIVLVPRLPHRVCKLVSPLKPLEAMASGRVCLASNVAPIADLITDKKTGYTFEAGDVDHLILKLHAISESRLDFAAIAMVAKEYIKSERNWNKIAKRMMIG